MRDVKLNKKGKRFYDSLQKTLKGLNSLYESVSLFNEVIRLHALYGMILSTPAKEIKKMKLRQIKKELEMLSAKKKEIDNEKIQA